MTLCGFDIANWNRKKDHKKIYSKEALFQGGIVPRRYCSKEVLFQGGIIPRRYCFFCAMKTDKVRGHSLTVRLRKGDQFFPVREGPKMIKQERTTFHLEANIEDR